MAMDIKEIEYVPAEASLPTDHGEFKIRIFNDAPGLDHVALTMGDMVGPDPTPVGFIQNASQGMHSEA